jgi:argininosuccinate synthase
MDANLLHISYEGGILEDPDFAPEDSMWRITVSPEKARQAPDHRTRLREGRHRLDRRQAPFAGTVLETLNTIGGKHGIGRLDMVENRYVGMKSRGCYETPGGTILLAAHRAIESITLDRGAIAPEGRADAALCRAGLQRLLVQHRSARCCRPRSTASQENVTGTVRLKLYKGSVRIVGPQEPDTRSTASRTSAFEEDAGAVQPGDAEGFIKLNALRLRILAERDKKRGKNE